MPPRLVIIVAMVLMVAAAGASYSVGRARGGIHCSGIYASARAAAILSTDARRTGALDAANRVKAGCFTTIVPLGRSTP
jgi:hypothetical protein